MPLIHTGRPWRTIYWIYTLPFVPYDFARGIWPNIRSPLVWDPSAVYTYLTSSDSGGEGDQAWFRLRFSFEIDRYTMTGTLKIALEVFLDDPATRKELARIWDDKPK